jgi:hypothetical protein
MLHKQTGKLIACIAENLPFMGTDVMQKWIENPKDLHEALHKALCPSWTNGFPMWRTLKLGTGLKTAGDFSNISEQSGCSIVTRGRNILSNPAFKVSETEAEVELVIVSVADLGFKERATCKDIYNRAKELGLDLCPAEVGPQLRLQYKDQPKGEMILIGMEPIADAYGKPRVFGVMRRNCGELCLVGADGHSLSSQNVDGRWVFLRHK